MIFLGFVSCGREQIKGLQLDIKFSEDKLSEGMVTNIQFSWRTDHDFQKIREGAGVFVHFWHGNNLLHQDYHVPEVLPSDWDAGREYMYSQQVYIPELIDESDPDFKGYETLKLSIGFYFPADGKGKSKEEILVKKLKVFPRHKF